MAKLSKEVLAAIKDSIGGNGSGGKLSPLIHDVKGRALKAKKAPNHRELLKQNPRLKRDSKGNYSY